MGFTCFCRQLPSCLGSAARLHNFLSLESLLHEAINKMSPTTTSSYFFTEQVQLSAVSLFSLVSIHPHCTFRTCRKASGP